MPGPLDALPAFLLAVLLISASPGPAMLLIVRRAALHGGRGAIPTVLGLEAGLFLWALAAGAGLAAVVAASEVAYTVLRVVGAAVLIWLGAKAWRAALADRGEPDLQPDEPARLPARRGGFLEGLGVQLANPKAAVFMFAFYPQFVPQDGAVMAWTAVFATIQVTVETALYVGFALAVGRASGWLRRSRVRRRLDAASGTLLVALGLRVATTSR
ncbi:MAG TPA: LysE family translocator [Capillimicrobium sp.]